MIFDLDGVIVSTDEYHYQVWKKLADEENIPFDHSINDRLRGVSRMASLEIILEKASRKYTQKEKEALTERKNQYYRDSLKKLTAADTLPNVRETLHALKEHGISIAIGSSSRNTMTILHQIDMADAFDAIADGTEITHSKPDPEVFLLAAKKVGADPDTCLVIEDAEAGLQAAHAGRMKAAGVGPAAQSPLADYSLSDIRDLLQI